MSGEFDGYTKAAIRQLQDRYEEKERQRIAEEQDDVNRICAAIQQAQGMDGPAFIQVLQTLSCKAAPIDDELSYQLSDLADGVNI